MSKVWRRLQRVGKKATKYKYTTYSHVLKINCTSKWQPDKVCITWSRRERKISSKLAQWEPDRINVYDGLVYWEKSTDMLEFDVSLYRGINDDNFEQKEWQLTVESEENKGKRRLLATGCLNLNEYAASSEPYFQTDITNMKLKPVSTKIKSVSISFSLSCQFLKDGKATDDDMISIASYMSSASLSNNPYLNSNLIFQTNTTSTTATTTNKQIKRMDTSKEEANDETNYIEQYLELNTNFNQIKNNFGVSSDVVVVSSSCLNESIQSQTTSDFEQSFLKSLDTTNINTSIINNKVQEEKETKLPIIKLAESNRMPSMEKLNIINNNPFAEEEIEEQLFIDNENDNKNPFIESTNPFLDTDDNENINLNLTNTSKDLLDWCKNIFKNSKVKLFQQLIIMDDFSKEYWMNGLALCAIIHSFKPNLINLKKLNEKEAKNNLKQVFDASDAEKIVRVIDFSDFLNKNQLDQLSIMTYLNQLRDHFESSSSTLQIENKNKSIQKTNNKKSTKTYTAPAQPTLSGVTTTKLMNPFDENDQDETSAEAEKIEINNNQIKKPTGLIQIKENGEIITDIEYEQDLELNNNNNNNNNINDTKFLVEKVKHQDNNQNYKSDELIQKAKNLIDKTKQNELIKREEINQKVKQLLARRKSAAASVAQTSIERKSSTSSINKLQTTQTIIGTEYVNQEIIHLKNEQKDLDEKGDNLENQLRILMKTKKSDKKSKELEDHLLKEWFLLVNRKNALLHKQQELEILQNEKDLEKRYELLSDKLRTLMQIEDFYKTEEQKRAENILLNELINNVCKRNELVEQLDEENKLLNEGEIINDYIQNKTSFQTSQQDKSCSIQ